MPATSSSVLETSAAQSIGRDPGDYDIEVTMDDSDAMIENSETSMVTETPKPQMIRNNDDSIEWDSSGIGE